MPTYQCGCRSSHGDADWSRAGANSGVAVSSASPADSHEVRYRGPPDEEWTLVPTSGLTVQGETDANRDLRLWDRKRRGTTVLT